MSPDLDSDDDLFGKRVATALSALPEGATELEVVARLRARLPADLARRAAQLHGLRRRSLTRFPAGHLPFLTRQGLEQASSHAVAAYRADQVLRRSTGGIVWDATSGIGADSVALAQRGLAVVTSDRDLFTLRCARANLRQHGFEARTVLADATTAVVRSEGVLLDPDRRPGGRRTLDPARWSPSLEQSVALSARAGAGCIELHPAFDPDAMPASARALGAQLSWISSRGELAAVDLWCGDWADDSQGALREVVALDGFGGATRLRGTPRSVPALSEARARTVAWLANPDPAVIRSGLLGTLAHAEGLAPLAPAIAFLGGDHPPRSPLLRGWLVLGTSPLDRKRVRALLREHDVGPIQVLKRGHPDPAEVLARRFRGSGDRPGFLAVTRLERGHLALLLAAADPVVGDEGFEPPTSSL